jgi:hypothetical protein
MTSSDHVGTLLFMVLMAVILVAGIILLTGKPLLPSHLPGHSVNTCPPGQECPPENVTSTTTNPLTPAESKLSTDLLQVMGRKALPQAMTRSALEEQMEQNHQLTHAAGTGETLVYVYIQMTGTAGAVLPDPYVWNVTNRDPASQLVVAWVDVNNLVPLASLESVRSIRTVSPPVTRK